jgi:hypothetical protein
VPLLLLGLLLPFVLLLLLGLLVPLLSASCSSGVVTT